MTQVSVKRSFGGERKSLSEAGSEEGGVEVSEEEVVEEGEEGEEEEEELLETIACRNRPPTFDPGFKYSPDVFELGKC